MTPFFDTVASFPTAIWSTLMVVVLGFWLLVIIGGMDIEILGGSDADVDVDADAGGGGVSEMLCLGSVPLTVVLSLIIFCAWTLSLLIQGFLGAWAGSWWFGIPFFLGTLLISFLGAVFLTSLAVRPLGRVFHHEVDRGGRALIGRPVTVISSRVDATFGQAEYLPPGSSGSRIGIYIVCDRDNDLRPGCEAVVLDYDEERDTYSVAPQAVSPTEAAAPPHS